MATRRSEADLPTKLASVHELRSTNDPHSLKQADLLTSGLSANGNDTLLDIGRTHPLIDTNLNDQSLGNRAYAADKYAASKDRRYRRIINDNNLPYGYKSLCMDTLGAFGTSLWSVIDRATDPNTHPKASGDYDPWRHPVGAERMQPGDAERWLAEGWGTWSGQGHIVICTAQPQRPNAPAASPPRQNVARRCCPQASTVRSSPVCRPRTHPSVSA